jgi:glyoxylase-like metal-dependent hydrolase (beta-lactamase superfamily II)
MPLSLFACANCGFWQRHFAPAACPVCEDVRNDLPEDGWRFLPEGDVSAAHAGEWRWVRDDMLAFTTTPALGLAGTGWLLIDPEHGNTAFEAAPWYSPTMLDEIARLGGIRHLSCSHVHGMGALWQLQEAFAPEVVAINVHDLQLTKAFRVTHPYDQSLELTPALTLHRTGGHYAGQAALHDSSRRLLFCGDMFKVEQDAGGRATAISSHWAFHKSIPLTPAQLRCYREVVAALEFDGIVTPFEYAPDVGRTTALAALDSAFAGPPGVRRFAVPPRSGEDLFREVFQS